MTLPMLEERLQAIGDLSQATGIAKEYFKGVCKSPLVILVYDKGTNNVAKHFCAAGESVLGRQMIKEVTIGRLEEQEAKLPYYRSYPQKAICLKQTLYDGIGNDGTNFDDTIIWAERLMRESGKFVFLVCNIGVISPEDDYRARIQNCFDIWHERVYMFVADNEQSDFADYPRRMEEKKRKEDATRKYSMFDKLVDKAKENCRHYIMSSIYPEPVQDITLDMLKELLDESLFSVRFEAGKDDDSLSHCIVTKRNSQEEVYFDYDKESGIIYSAIKKA